MISWKSSTSGVGFHDLVYRHALAYPLPHLAPHQAHQERHQHLQRHRHDLKGCRRWQNRHDHQRLKPDLPKSDRPKFVHLKSDRLKSDLPKSDRLRHALKPVLKWRR